MNLLTKAIPPTLAVMLSVSLVITNPLLQILMLFPEGLMLSFMKNSCLNSQ